MNDISNTRFQIFVDGIQTGNIGRWKHAPLMVASQWKEGSDDEKFEVLSAIRRTYNLENENDIRGNEKQTPSQIGRAEGFTKLSYKRAISLALQIEIVKPIAPYRRMVLQSKFKIIDWPNRPNQ